MPLEKTSEFPVFSVPPNAKRLRAGLVRRLMNDEALPRSLERRVAPPARRKRTPPALGMIGSLLADYCRGAGITRLEAFGSTARGDCTRGSDVDLLATFAINPGLRFFTMEEEMAAILGVPVHLLTRDAVEQMSNPYRRESILADARVIYEP